MLTYKIDILAALKAAGYSTAKLRKEKLFGEATLQKMRQSDTNITLDTIDRLCNLLGCQPQDLIEYKRPL